MRFKRFSDENSVTEETALYSDTFIPDVFVTSKEIAAFDSSKAEKIKDPYLEFVYFILPFSDKLLHLHRCALHGTAFLWHGKAFIFCGPSGVGKSTQYRNWKKLYGQEISILNGDKPVLEWMDSDCDCFIVHPSPWNGKENWRGNRSAELAGIIYLEQGNTNILKRVAPSDMVLPLMQEFLYSAGTTEVIQMAVEMERKLLSVVPVWKLTNSGSLESSRLTHDQLENELALGINKKFRKNK